MVQPDSLRHAEEQRARYLWHKVAPSLALMSVSFGMVLASAALHVSLMPSVASVLACSGAALILLVPGAAAYAEHGRTLRAGASGGLPQTVPPTTELDGLVTRMLPHLDEVDRTAVTEARSKISELRRHAEEARSALAGLDPTREGTRSLQGEVDASLAEADVLEDGLAVLAARWMAEQREHAPDVGAKLAVSRELAEVRTAAHRARSAGLGGVANSPSLRS